MTIPELAERAYVAYCQSKGFGPEIWGAWPHLGSESRDHWCAAAEAVVTATRAESESRPAVPTVILATGATAAEVFRALAEQRGVTHDGSSKRDPTA